VHPLTPQCYCQVDRRRGSHHASRRLWPSTTPQRLAACTWHLWRRQAPVVRATRTSEHLGRRGAAGGAAPPGPQRFELAPPVNAPAPATGPGADRAPVARTLALPAPGGRLPETCGANEARAGCEREGLGCGCAGQCCRAGSMVRVFTSQIGGGGGGCG